MMRRWTTSLLVAAILCVLFYGCGLITDHIFITYHAQEDVNRIEEAGNVAIKVKVFDLRTKLIYLRAENEVGNKGLYNGLIVANNDLKELLARAIETELTNQGFKSGERVLIEVDLVKFYSHFTALRTSAKLIFHIRVKKMDGTLVYSNVVRGEGVNPDFVVLVHGNHAKVALARALKDGISRLVNDPEFIASLIKANVN